MQKKAGCFFKKKQPAFLSALFINKERTLFIADYAVFVSPFSKVMTVISGITPTRPL